MALFSLIIKQPFTFQVSKRDYPEIYWKEKTFSLFYFLAFLSLNLI